MSTIGRDERNEGCAARLQLHLLLETTVSSFSKASDVREKLKYKVLRVFREEGGSLGKETSRRRTGQFRGWIEQLSSQGEQSLRQIFTRGCILSMWVSATLDHVGRVGHRGPNWGTVATHPLPRSILSIPLQSGVVRAYCASACVLRFDGCF